MKTPLYALVAASLLLVAQPAFALQSPDQVKAALTVLNRVVNHMGRLMAAKNYDRLPHENGEFKEGAAALETALTGEPADFKAKVERLLQQAETDADSVASTAATHDDAKITAAHDKLAASVPRVLAAFPPEVQPAPLPTVAPPADNH